MDRSNVTRKEKQIEIVPLKEIFTAYCRMDPVSAAMNVEAIPLTQSDKWLLAAGLLDMVKLTTTDTGLAYFKFRKRALSYDEYLSYLKDLAVLKNLDFDNMIEKMQRCRKPVPAQDMKKVS